METVMQVLGWAGLAGAVLGAVVVLKLALLILRVLRQIELLVRIARDGAEGLLVNLGPLSSLGALEQPAAAVGEESAAIATLTTRIERRLGPLDADRAAGG